MAPASVTARVPAKVNLQLSVGPVRKDGYHELVTVFHAVSLVDEVTVRASTSPGVHLTMSGPGTDDLPVDDTNLAVKAALLLAEHADVEPAIDMHVRKAIPVAGGMAGGSADAAGALVACDAFWRADTSRADLDALAARLGSDVTFALHGGTAIGTGRGEAITPVLTRGHFSWVFALADGGLSTPAVYRECDRLREGRPVREPYVSELLMQALRAGDPVLLGKALANDLQPAALSLRPALARVLDLADDAGALGAIVSGSGPTCALLARDPEHALDLAVALTSAQVCRTVVRAEGPVPGARVVG